MPGHQHLQQLHFDLGFNNVDHLNNHDYKMHVRVSQFNLLDASFNSVPSDDPHAFCTEVTRDYFYASNRVIKDEEHIRCEFILRDVFHAFCAGVTADDLFNKR